MPRAVTAADLSTDFAFEEHSFRGRVYRVTELPINEYDKLRDQATKEVDAPFGNGKIKETDDDLLARLMLMKTVTVDGKRLTAEDRSELGTRLILRLTQIMNRLHFGEEPEEVKELTAKSEGDEGNA